MANKWRLVEVESGEIIVPKLQVANTFWSRFRGLQLRRSLPSDEGLLLQNCRSIHTHWMRFAIDVAMLDKSGRVLAIHSAVAPWRIVGRVRGTEAILETVAGAIGDRIRVGDVVQVENLEQVTDE